MKSFVIVASFALLLVGCSTGSDYAQTSRKTTEEPAMPANHPSTPETMPAQDAMPNAPDQKDLAELEKSYDKAKADYAKGATDASKAKLVESTVAYGTGAMMTDALDRKVKYRKALELYREALKLDPANKEAKENADMIISIYKSMGRPVPQALLTR